MFSLSRACIHPLVHHKALTFGQSRRGLACPIITRPDLTRPDLMPMNTVPRRPRLRSEPHFNVQHVRAQSPDHQSQAHPPLLGLHDRGIFIRSARLRCHRALDEVFCASSIDFRLVRPQGPHREYCALKFWRGSTSCCSISHKI